MQNFNCINEEKNLLTFEFPELNAYNRVAIALLKHDHATKEIPTSGSYRRFQIDMDRVSHVTAYKRLEQFTFSAESTDVLRKIRINNNGKPAGQYSGQINIDFNFPTLYDWLKDGRTRSSRRISRGNAEERKQKREVKMLESTKYQLIQEKQELSYETNYYKHALQEGDQLPHPETNEHMEAAQQWNPLLHEANQQTFYLHRENSYSNNMLL